MDMPKVDKLPDEYLLLNVGRKSAFAGKPNSHAMGGGPLELRRVAPGRDDLIAVWYRTYRPSPAFPPVLTTSGWARNHNFVAAASANLSIKAFLDQSIDNAKTPPRRAGLN
jgi:hypothetical protein